MSEAREFESMEDMKEHIVSGWKEMMDGRTPFTVDDIVIGEETMNDSRNGWSDTRNVCIKRYMDEHFSHPACIGWCATEYNKNT